ncbi:replication initiator protein A [Lactovum miscens]|uniref:Replication initiator A N-terminal domain-containing protein n=1 Tax=Lactovum miscens TaxID=190387 RepID=A0A841C144_9LACT|nr:replication initiator protein A [Lactovum miscens]MBB5887626.1 hypothetical protein [Lactovum miscens]
MEKITLNQVVTSQNFYQYPKLFTPYREKNSEGEVVRIASKYIRMKNEAKILYTFLKNRFELSIINNFVDENEFVYVIATVEELSDVLSCSKRTVITLKNELKDFGLIEEVKQGLNKPNRIYVGNLDGTQLEKTIIEKKKTPTTPKIKDVSGGAKFAPPEGTNAAPQEMQKSQPSYIESSHEDEDEINNKALQEKIQKIQDQKIKIIITKIQKMNLPGNNSKILICNEILNEFEEGQDPLLINIFFDEAFKYTTDHLHDLKYFGKYLVENMKNKNQLNLLENKKNQIEKDNLKNLPQIPVTGPWSKTDTKSAAKRTEEKNTNVLTDEEVKVFKRRLEVIGK